MGLDMYLHKKTYVKNWEHEEKDKRVNIVITGCEGKIKHIKPERISEIVEEIIYWRKANQIHAFFIGEEEDNCSRDYYVSFEKLQDLYNRCVRIKNECPLIEGKVKNGSHYEDGKLIDKMEDGKIMQNQELAEELLPSQGGFFFGGTDYDEYYMQDIEYTIEKLKPIIEEGEDRGDYYYSASW
jgi:hypothetical protein